MVSIMVFVFVFAMSFMMFMFFRLFSGFIALLGLVNFGLFNISISLIRPHGIRSQVFLGAVCPEFFRNLTKTSALIVLTDFHGASVLIILHGLDFGNESGFFFHFVECPVGANIDDIALFSATLIFSIHHFAPLEGLDGTNAGSGQFICGEHQNSVLSRRELFILVGAVSPLVALQGVVVAGEHPVPVDAIRVDVRGIELVAPSESEGHSVLGWHLAEGERIKIGKGSSYICQ